MPIYAFNTCYEKDFPKVELIAEEFGFVKIKNQYSLTVFLHRESPSEEIFLRYCRSERYPLSLVVDVVGKINENDNNLFQLIQKLIIATGASKIIDAFSSEINIKNFI